MPLGLDPNKYTFAVPEKSKQGGLGLDPNKYTRTAPIQRDTTLTETGKPLFWLTSPDLMGDYLKEVKKIDYTVMNNLARIPSMVANSIYYAESIRGGGIVPTFGATKKNIPFTSLTDAIKKGWSGESRTPTWAWTAGLFTDPRAVESARQDWEVGWQKWPLLLVTLAESIAISTVGWTGYGRVAKTLKDTYTLGKLKTNKTFVQNVGAAVKQTIKLPNMSDSDAALLAIYNKTGEKFGGVEARRFNQELVRKYQDEQQNLLYQKTHADELYAGSIIEKSHVDNIPEPEYIGDQRIDIKVQAGKVIKGAGKTEPITAERISKGAHPIEEARFETVITEPGIPPVLKTVGRKDVESLKSLGYTDIQIRKMIPEDANWVVDNKVTADKVSVLKDGSVKEIRPTGLTESAKGKTVTIAGQKVTLDELFTKIDHGKVASIEEPAKLGGYKKVIFEDGFVLTTNKDYKIGDVMTPLGDNINQTQTKIPSGGEKEAQEALDYMMNEVNQKKVDAHINDTQAAETKFTKETLEEQKVRIELDIKNAERNLKLAQQGRLFLTPESESRAIREEYARAYMFAFRKEFNPESLKGAKLETFRESRAKQANMTNEDFTHIVEVLTDQVSHGRTFDISGLSNDEFATIFNAIDSMAEMGPSLFYMKEHDILEMINPSWDYLERLGAPGVYLIPNNAAMQLMRDTHDWLDGWHEVLRQVGIAKTRGKIGRALGEAGIVGTKRLDKFGNPSVDNIVGRSKIANILRRMFLYGDGHPVYGDTHPHPKPNTGAKLTPDEVAFMKETADKVGSGELAITQINTEINGAQYVRNIMDHLSTLGERHGFLYDPANKNKYFTDEELNAKGAVPKRSNYVTHKILQMVEDIEKMDAKQQPYYAEAVRKFFAKHANIPIDIPEMKLRQGTREGLVQNIDTAFRIAIQHEGFKFYMEPAFKQAAKLAKSIDDIHLVNVLDDKSVSTYTAKWINQAFRGQMQKPEKVLNNLTRSIQRNSMHGVGKVLSLIRKMIGQEPDNIFSRWEPAPYERAFKTFSNQYRRYVYSTAMGLNPSSVLKNMTQVLLINPIIGTRATLEGMKSVWVGGADALRYSDTYFARGVAIHELSLDNATKISNLVSFPFRLVDQYINCASAFNGSLWRQIFKDKSKLEILRNYGYEGNSSGKSFWQSMSKAIKSGEFRAEVKMADMVTKRTQFSYVPWDMPKALWSPVGKIAGQFMSYPMNYFTQYLPYLGRMAQTGIGPFGTMSKGERYSLLKHIVQAEGIALMGELSGIDVSYVSPVHAAGRGVYNTIQVWRGEQKPNEATYQQGPLPSFPPAINSIMAIGQEVGVMDSGRPSALKEVLTGPKSALMMDPYAKPGEWTGYLPGSLPRTISKVASGKKSPLALIGISPYSERKVGKRR